MVQTLTNIVIVGQGAIGLLWYHHLAQMNIPLYVSLLASNQAQLTLAEQQAGQYKFTYHQQITAENFPLNYAQKADIQKADIILLCVKSFHIASALQQFSADISRQCKIILAHNGMGTFEEIKNIFPKKQAILTMLTTHGSLRDGPLNIIHTGLGHSDIGLLSGELSLVQQRELTHILNRALPKVNFHENILEKQWLKLAINCVINPITAINDINNGEVNQAKYAKQITSLLTEIKAVSKKVGINFTLPTLQEMVRNVAQATAQNCSSMRCDVLAGQRTEIDYINGYIHRLGQKYHVATPENSRLWQQVLNIN